MAAPDAARPSLGAGFLQLAAAFLVVASAASVGLQWFVRGAEGSSERVETLMLAQLCGFVALGVFALLWRPSVGWSPRRAVLAFVSYPVFLLAWIPLCMFGYGWFLENVLEVTLEPQATLAYFTQPAHAPWGRALVIATACVLGPVVEEVLYRGYMQPLFGRIFPPALAIGGTALLFGLMHGPMFAFPTFLLGLWFGWLRHRSDSLLAPTLAHMLHNTVMVVAVPYVFDSVYAPK